MQLELGDNIKKCRREMDLTQEALAEAFGVTVGAVSKWESGSTVPDILTLIQLADFFNVSVDVLLGYAASSKSVTDISEKLNRLLRESRYQEALSEADKALIRYPGNFKILHTCAKLYNVVSVAEGYKHHLERAIELYESALKYLPQNTDPDVDEFSIRLCIAELKSVKDPEGALQEFQKINHMGIADVNIAMLLTNSGRADEALERFTRVLVSVLVKSLQLSSNMAIALATRGSRADIQEARDVLDWCLGLFEATCGGQISYLTKMQVVLLVLKAMALSCLEDYGAMEAAIDRAYELALEFDKNPTNGICGRIRFWHGEEDFKPTLYDELGQGAVQSIDALFPQTPHPLSEALVKKMARAREYWNAVKARDE